VGVKGNFDDCQTMVKEIFADEAYNKRLAAANFELSSANSINWGRLVPQIIYYFWGYLQMVREKQVEWTDAINAVVPTGNFGNILAGYYAREMGLPIKTLICASNKNKVLADFIESGVYDRKRTFFQTTSPSMDILISSNLERFLFELTKHNPRKINEWYEKLGATGAFKIDDTTRQRMNNALSGGYAEEEEVSATIKRVFDKTRYTVDPHTAVGVSVYEKYLAKTGDKTPAFICSTASPYKFNESVYVALTADNSEQDEFRIIEKLEKYTGLPLHPALSGLSNMRVLHDRVINVKKGRDEVLSILGVAK
jgi:threonine synthase